MMNGVVIASSTLLDADQKAQLTYSKGTKIRYRMAFQPGFWVPPVIGGYLVEKALVADGTQILNRMEKYAQKHYGKSVSVNPTSKQSTESRLKARKAKEDIEAKRAKLNKSQ